MSNKTFDLTFVTKYSKYIDININISIYQLSIYLKNI